MKLYVMRHGTALSVSEAGVSTDAERPLAKFGREDVRQMAGRLKDDGARIRTILCSPLKRARQTADEAASVLSPNPNIHVFAPLSNQLPGGELFEALKTETQNDSDLLIVGHQPQLGEMVAHLIGHAVAIQPGGLVALDIHSQEKARLLWSENPR